ncbi:MAG: MFS transporter [Dehalococcoidales bacterium]|nr:MFS transporter [Dehalococcoidales bacterium]
MGENSSQSKLWQLWQRTFSSLRYRDYRLIWLGSWAEHIGEMMENMAIAWLMMKLTGSPYYTGLLIVARTAPLLPFALAGGVVTDRVDRRKLLIFCLLGGASVSITLFILAFSGLIAWWHLLVAAGLSGMLTGFNHPARGAIVPNVVPRHELMNAIALDTISVRSAALIAAIAGGILISQFGTSVVFGARAIGVVVAIQWLFMAKVPATPVEASERTPWHNLGEGLKYTGTSALVSVLLGLFALRQFSQEMPEVFMPFFAADILQIGAIGFGFLKAALGLGSVVGLFTVASLGNFRYKGWLVIITGILMGLFISAFALSTWVLLSLAFLIVASTLGTVMENVSRAALQSIIPDQMRGRIMSLREAMRGVFSPVMAYGFGLGGERLGVVVALSSFGVFIIVCLSLMAFLIPSLRRLK